MLRDSIRRPHALVNKQVDHKCVHRFLHNTKQTAARIYSYTLERAAESELLFVLIVGRSMQTSK